MNTVDWPQNSYRTAQRILSTLTLEAACLMHAMPRNFTNFPTRQPKPNSPDTCICCRYSAYYVLVAHASVIPANSIAPAVGSSTTYRLPNVLLYSNMRQRSLTLQQQSQHYGGAVLTCLQINSSHTPYLYGCLWHASMLSCLQCKDVIS